MARALGGWFGLLITWLPIVWLVYSSYITAKSVAAMWTLELCPKSGSAESRLCVCPSYGRDSHMQMVVFLTNHNESFTEYSHLTAAADLTPLKTADNSTIVRPIYEWAQGGKIHRVQLIHATTDLQTHATIPVVRNAQTDSSSQHSLKITLPIDVCSFLEGDLAEGSPMTGDKNVGLYLHMIAYFSRLPPAHESKKKRAQNKQPLEDGFVKPARMNAVNAFMYSVAPLTTWLKPDAEKRNLLSDNFLEHLHSNHSDEQCNANDSNTCGAESHSTKRPVYEMPDDKSVLHARSKLKWFWVNEAMADSSQCLSLRRTAREVASLFSFKKFHIGYQLKQQQVAERKQKTRRLRYDPIFFRTALTDLRKYAKVLPKCNSTHSSKITENASVKNELFDLTISFEGISFGWLRLYSFMQGVVDSMQSQFGMDGGSDLDDIKALFVETNPYLTLATMVVSILHTIFSILAIKSDVDFWAENDETEGGKIVGDSGRDQVHISEAPKRKTKAGKGKAKKRRNKEGLSLNAIIFECVSSFVVFAYLADSRSSTSWLLLVFGFGDCLLSLWKLTRVFAVKNRRQATGGAQTHESLDALATRKMCYALIPLVAGYALYSLCYDEHKSALSYVLYTAATSVYGLGFIVMTPQLFINYELKSVAALPWKTLIYRALNTFVDDLFSFVIDMPTIHRIACFRDDIVFFVFLYQWWIYGSEKEEGTGKKKKKQGLKKGGKHKSD